MNDNANQSRREYMREYMRRYRKEHPDRVAEAQSRYWQKRFEKENKTTVDDGRPQLTFINGGH